KPGETDLFMRPVTGVIDRALEAVEASDIGPAGIGKATGREYDKSRRRSPAVRGGYGPTVRVFVEGASLDGRVELDVGTEIEPIPHVVGVAQNSRLRRVAFAPVPLLLQFVRERIGILHALDIAAGAWIAVPVPGPPDARALLVDAHRESKAAQPVEHVHSGKAGPDHDNVVSSALAAVQNR